MTDWKTEMTWLTILYRMLECKEQIPVLTDGTAYEFIENDLENLTAKELVRINIETSMYEITDAGRGVCERLLAMYDPVLKFEIFSSVSVAQTLQEDEVDDEGNFHPQLYDARFQKPKSLVEQEELGTEDMRLTVMDFLATEMSTDAEPLDLDPHRIVFIQMLSTGKLKSDEIFFDLSVGTTFTNIEEVVSSAYKWQDSGDDDGEARQAMISIYTAGMIEQRKRDGQECSDCGSPLAIFETWAKEDGKTLDTCPNPDCKCTFTPPPPEYECPACKAGVTNDQRVCSCGAILDFSLPAGTIQTEAVEESEDDYESVWSYDYGFIGTPYMDPYDPFLNVTTFGLVCCVLW